MRAPEAVPNGAQYLDQVEKVVGLTFFSHATQELAARTDITQLAPEDLQPRTPLYIAGLKLLAAARRDIQLPKDSLPQLTAEQVAEIRKSHQPEIEAIRTGLLGLAEAEPPANYLSFTAMATDLEIGRPMLKRAISQLGIVAVPYRNNQNQANAYYSATDIHDIITHVNSTLPLAHATDVRTAHLRETYRLESHTTFNAILEELGITPVAKRPSTRERWAHFTSAADAKRIEAYVQKMTATPEWMSVADIAEQGGVSPGTVNNYIASQGYTDQIRVLRTPATDDSMPVHTPHLPYSLAEGTIQKFRMIIPDEYMTINEFAACSGLNQKQISKAITRMGLTTHNFTSHSGERRAPFLDGATMYKLRQHLHPYESAPADWVDMQGFKRAVQASDTVIGKYLKDTEWEDMGRMKPSEGANNLPRTFYPPEAVAYVNSKLPPTVPPTGWINLTAEAKTEGTAITVIRNRLLDLGYTTPAKIRQGNNLCRFYPPAVMHDSRVKAIIGQPPSGWEALPDVAATLGLSAVDMRLLLAEKGAPVQVHKLDKSAKRVVYCPSPDLLNIYGIHYSSPDWPGAEPVVYDAPESFPVIPAEYATIADFAALYRIPQSLIRRYLINHPETTVLPLEGHEKSNAFLDGATMHTMRNVLRSSADSITLSELAVLAGVTDTVITNRLQGTPWQSPEPTVHPTRAGRAIGHYPPEAVEHVLHHSTKRGTRSPKHTPAILDGGNGVGADVTAKRALRKAPPSSTKRATPFMEPIVKEARPQFPIVPTEYMTVADFIQVSGISNTLVKKYLSHHPDTPTHTFEARRSNVFLDGATVHALRKALITPEGAVTIDELARLTGVSKSTARRHLKGTPWQSPTVTQPSDKNRPVGRYYPIEALAYLRQSAREKVWDEPIVRDAPLPDLVIPPEYLTPGEFAKLEDLNTTLITRHLKSHPEIATHQFRKGQRYNLLDGAAIYALRHNLRAAEGSVSLPELAQLAGISKKTAASYLKGSEWENLEPTKPRDPAGKTHVHYPPEAVAYVQSRVTERKQAERKRISQLNAQEPVIKPARAPDTIIPDEYLTPREFAKLHRIPFSRVEKYIKANPFTPLHTYDETRYNNVFLDGSTIRALAVALWRPTAEERRKAVEAAKETKRAAKEAAAEVRRTAAEAAEVNRVAREAAAAVKREAAAAQAAENAKAKAAKKAQEAATKAAEKAESEAAAAAAAEAAAAEPAQPVWRPSSWRVDREESFVLESGNTDTQPLASPGTGRPGVMFGAFSSQRQAGETTLGLPPEKQRRPATHKLTAQTDWQPAQPEPSPGTFISRTEKLTPQQIADRLKVGLQVVQSAIASIDFGDDKPEARGSEQVYRSSGLVAIREQIVGIPIEHLARELNISGNLLERLPGLLRRNGFEVYGDRISPAAQQFLAKNISTWISQM